ncbi:MAG: CinA family protein [Rickettsiales bacterium]|nr:CinA family protein [Rickettsiales bacterium]
MMFSDTLIQAATDLLAMCRARRLTIATAESCTGGLIGALLTEIPGSSDVFECGFASYSYAAKTNQLGVSKEMIVSRGAVSEEVALAMAIGARARSGASMAVAVTGIAGPGGGTPEKPVGMVCLAVASQHGSDVVTCQFTGDRSSVRLQSVAKALEMLRAAMSSFS